MAKNKKSSTPLPKQTQALMCLFLKLLCNCLRARLKDELVIPGASIVHPSAGPIPRRDVQTIRESNRVMFHNLEEQSNGTVISPTKDSNPNPELLQNLFHQCNEWSELFKGSLTAKGILHTTCGSRG